MFWCSICLIYFSIFLIIPCIYSLPVQPIKNVEYHDGSSEEDDSDYQLVYEPYDVKYVPVEASVNPVKTYTPAFIESSSEEEFVKNKTEADSSKGRELVTLPLSVITEQDVDTLDRSVPLGDARQLARHLILVPDLESYEENNPNESNAKKTDFILISVLPIQKIQSTIDASSSDEETEKIFRVKRQAPGNGVIVLRPVVRFRGVLRIRRRVVRPPPLVGYLRDSDRFPTVA